MSEHEPGRLPQASLALADGEISRLIHASTVLLGPSAPLPALLEETLRSWQGSPVTGTRFEAFTALFATLQTQPSRQAELEKILGDHAESVDARLLAAILWAHAHLPAVQALTNATADDDDAALLYAVSGFNDQEITYWYVHTLNEWLGNAGDPEVRQARVLPLLCFLRALRDGALTDEEFAACVLHGGLLAPEIAPHHPLRRLHRLLDYTGLSEMPYVQRRYQRLVSTVWPRATVKQWSSWRWITVPGGPEIFSHALTELATDERALLQLHALKYAVLPGKSELASLLATASPATQLLLALLRPGVTAALTGIDDAAAVLRWMKSSNQAAAATAYAAPAWWPPFCGHGLTVMRDVLTWLQTLSLPIGESLRQTWLEQHYLPHFTQICANLLLAQATTGERLEEITALAQQEYLPAIRALALMPKPSEEMLALLYRVRHMGGKPVRQAAQAALDHLARRQGFPGADELERQQLLTAAWDSGPFAGERVRVGWQEGGYRIRLSLHQGKVQLDVLGPLGPVTRIPQELRQRASYREAREAQRQAQAQYRLFKEHLERYLLDARPISLGEFRYLLANPIFAHLAERLIWQTGEGDAFLWCGPDQWHMLNGQALEITTGRADASFTVTLAHPIELARRHELIHWQALAADRRLVQPIKQVFREIYTADAEQGLHCARFAARRIDPARAYALLRGAGYSPGTGVARREWPQHITAHLCWARDAVSHDLFGPQRKSEVITGDIWFTLGTTPLPLHEVSPIVFSETLRAADLLTTRAAVGDAELTSRETIALRAALLREVARSYRLTNLAVLEEGQYAIVLGKRATYRVNLASGTILLEPEGRQIMLPEQQERWHPAESYDTTSEVLATILTLVHDEQIADLTFLAQLTPHAGQ